MIRFRFFMSKIFLFLSCLITINSCKTLSYVPIVPVNFGSRSDVPKLTGEDEIFLKSISEKQIEEVSDCQLLGTVTGKGRGGLSGRWEAKKNVKIEAAKKRADTVVFGPVPKWELTETHFSGTYYRCEKISKDE